MEVSKAEKAITAYFYGNTEEIWKQDTDSVAFEFLTAVVMKNSIFWDITPCSTLKVSQHFGGTCRLHLQGRRMMQARNQDSACNLLQAGFLLGLFFDPEDGGDLFFFFRNIG
jgi:hypothetical protein